MGHLLRTLHRFRPRSIQPVVTVGHAGLRLLVTLCLAFVLVGLLAAGCTLFEPRVDPYADIRQNLIADFPITDAELDALPVYSITTRIDPVEEQYTGTLTLSLPITGTGALDRLYFRSYPNLITFGGNLQVTGASVNGVNVNFGPAADGTAVELIVPEPLEPGTRGVWLAFNGSLPDPEPAPIYSANEEVLGDELLCSCWSRRTTGRWIFRIRGCGLRGALYIARVGGPPG